MPIMPLNSGIVCGKANSYIHHPPLGTVSESGVKGKQDGIQGYQAWIIVGTVGGFIGGVVLGMLVVIIYKHFGIGRRNKTIDLIRPRAITNDTNGECKMTQSIQKPA